MKLTIEEIALLSDASIQAAARQYIARKNRDEHPDGSFDNAGRWYPDASEGLDTDYFRSPSRAYPYSYMTACRSLEHVAALHDVYINHIDDHIRELNMNIDEEETLKEANAAKLLAVKRVAKLLSSDESVNDFILKNSSLKFKKDEDGEIVLVINDTIVDRSIFEDKAFKYLALTKEEMKADYNLNIEDVKENEVCLVGKSGKSFFTKKKNEARFLKIVSQIIEKLVDDMSNEQFETVVRNVGVV